VQRGICVFSAGKSSGGLSLTSGKVSELTWLRVASERGTVVVEIDRRLVEVASM